MFLTIILMLLSGNSSRFQVVVENVEVGKGNIVVEIFDNETNFLKRSILTKVATASNERLVFNFELPNGVYAVSVFQDENKNNRCDKNWFSIPIEPYGLSNSFRPGFSKPKFDDCKFTLTNSGTETIYLEK